MREVLITGGLGFLGSHLVDRLIEDPNNHISVVDDLSQNVLEPEELPSGVSFHLCKTNNFSAGKFDEIYHAASLVGPVSLLKHAGNIARSVLEDTYHIMSLCHNETKLCYLSTGEVYGSVSEHGCHEDDPKYIITKSSPRQEYAVAKLLSEIAIQNSSKFCGSYAIVRPFNISGPRQKEKGGFVIPRFINQARQGVPITVYGDGKMIRAFTHVEDVVNGIILATHHKLSGIYNLGNANNKTTVLELANLIQRLLRSRSEIIFVDPKQLHGPLFEECADKFPNTQRAKQLLGWEPRHSLEKIISDVQIP